MAMKAQMRNENLNVLVFDGGAGIWAHSATEASLIRTLVSQKVPVSVFSCDSVLEGQCTVRQSRKRTLADIKRSPQLDCIDCKFAARLISSRLNAPGVQQLWLTSFLTHGDISAAREYANSSALDAEFFEAIVEEIPLPKLAAYDLTLKFKSLDTVLFGEGSEEYRLALYNVFVMMRAARELFGRDSSYSHVVIRSPHYSVNSAFARVAKQAGVKVIFLDGSPNISEDTTHMSFWDWNLYASGNPMLRKFSSFFEDPKAEEILRIARHREALLLGRSHKVYSNKKGSKKADALDTLGIAGKGPVLLFALSSTDEIEAAQSAQVNPDLSYPGNVFSSQFDWIEQTIAWLESKPNVSGIIRVHPREYPNKRESRRSPNADRWEALLSGLPANTFVNYPEQAVSIYDLFESVDAVVTGWSSVGLEAATFGLPVVLYDQALPNYPPDIGLAGTSRESYFANLERIIEGDFDATANRVAAERWQHLIMNIGTSRIGGRFLASQRNTMPRMFHLILAGAERYLFPLYLPLDLWWGKIAHRSDGKIKTIIFDGQADFFPPEVDDRYGQVNDA
jgi:hypothetical protein